MNPELMIATAAELNPELAERMQFILELDRLKNVLRKNVLADGSRHENSAEHSWHLAMTAMVMAPHARTDIQLDKVIKMLLVHDVIEIDAGDVDIFDVQARADNEANERRAAERIFGLLPEPHASELKALWEEFEARQTPEAQFAYSCDRFQPFLLNLAVDGKAWRERGVTATQVKDINSRMDTGLESVWPVAEHMLAKMVDEGSIEP